MLCSFLRHCKLTKKNENNIKNKFKKYLYVHSKKIATNELDLVPFRNGFGTFRS